MKTLYLTRHAKSSWDQPYLADIDRPLKKRGINDSHLIADILGKSGRVPQRIVSSPAARARLTAQLYAEDFELDPSGIKIVDDLYLSSPGTMINSLKSIDDKWRSVMMVVHNPGITDFVNRVEGVRVDNVPTAAVAIIVFQSDTWSEIDISSASLAGFEYPSKYK